ncbi:MAG: DUF11 domain-containing protein, partial [Xanthomonadales bacterium]|nr:DUF11 domain-containing protein [Xanthomonadales bacterium]
MLERFLRVLTAAGLAAVLALSFAGPALSDPDLPNPPANIETIPSGSLIIPMDNDKQNIGFPFNTAAYGLATHLLHAGVPVKWAITAGKSKDGIDFSAESQQLYPVAGGTAVRDFRGGPFIIHRDFATLATPVISAFGNNVAVHELTQDASVDVRYDLVHKPKVAVFDDGGNAKIHRDLLLDAGFVLNTHLEVIPAASLATINANACFTMGSEPHWGETPTDPLVDAAAEAIRDFVLGGGNFLAQCEAIATYENNPTFGLFHSTAGVEENNTGNTLFDYANPDLSYSQFQGELDPGGGSIHDYQLIPPAPPNTWRADTQFHVQNTPVPQQLTATARKLTAGTGSLIYLLGKHEYKDGDLEDLNGRRMYLNAVMTPSGRPQACLLEVVTATVSGTVYEDINGDSQLADAVGVTGVRLRLYADTNDNGVVDAGDTFISEGTSGAGGAYTFTVSVDATGSRYLVAADSRTVSPSTGFNFGFGQDDVWAQQTYGDDSATPGLDVAPRFGGRSPGVSDDVDAGDTTPGANNYQHLARVDVSGGDVATADFAFTFNALTNVRVGDDDPASNRLIQGSFGQFLQNANAIAGGNAMRFVPALPPNSGSWWTISQTAATPALQDAGTTIDGTAYEASDGTTPRDENAGEWTHPVLVGKAVGTGPDGREGTGDEPVLPSYFNPELEIDAGGFANGLEIGATNTNVRNIAVFNASSRSVWVNGGSGNLIEKNFVGLRADGSDPGAALHSNKGVSLTAGGANVVDNVVAYLEDGGIETSVQALIQGNDVYSTGLIGDFSDSITAEGSIGQPITVRQNRTYSSSSYGIEAWQAPGPFTITDNTVMQSGRTGNVENGGIRVFGDNSVVQNNVVTDNAGNGVVVSFINSVGVNSSGNRISQNAIYGNGGLGIDLDQTNTAPAANPNGDGVTQNDGTTVASQQNIGFDFPVLDQAGSDGANLTLTGFSRPGAVVELFVSDSDPSGFGEGQTYLITLTEGGTGAGGNDPVADLDAGTGSYSNPFNGLNQGADPAASRFRFVIPLASLPGVGVGTTLTATARDASGNTSEFSGNLPVTTTYSISGTVYHDSNDNGALDMNELGVGNQAWVKLIDPVTGSVVAVVQGDFDEPDYTGDFSFSGLANGNYELIVDDNADPSDATATAPYNWQFRNPGLADYPVAVTVSGADVTGQALGLTFNIVSPCLCGVGDGVPTQLTITINGDMSDWAAPQSDLDNNACDESGSGDRDDPIQSTGRDMVRMTVTFDASRFFMFTERAASTNNTQNYIYYADTSNNGLMETGEPVVVAEWSGNTGNVVLELYTYVADDAVFGDRMSDINGYADGYTLPGYLDFVKTFPAADAQGSTSGPNDGIQMEWAIDWADLGVAPGAAISWHVSSTNSNSYENPNFPNQVDDNMGGCGGMCSGSNQFAGVDPNPVNVIPGGTVYLVHQFTNTGNGIDRFEIESTSSGDFAPVSFAYYRDLGTVGEFDPADVLLTDTDGDSIPDTGVLAAGETFDMLVAVAMPGPPAVGTITVTTTAESNFQPGCGALLTPVKGSIDDLLKIPGSDIAATKTDGQVSAIPGQTITYSITITNGGPDDATGVLVADTFDPVIFDVPAISWTCGIVGTGSCADPGPTSGDISTSVDLDVSAVATFTVSAPTKAEATGTVSNTVTTTVVNEVDPDTGNNSATDSDTVLAPQADLSLTKTVDNAAPQAGETIVFTLTLANAGPSIATNVQVTDLLPAGYTYVSDDGGGSYISGTGIWTAGSVPAAGGATLNITVTTNSSGPYENIAEVTASDATDPNSIPGNGDPGEDDYASNTPAVNSPPVANDDSATTPTDTPVNIDVLVNDSDPNGDPLTITGVTAPANGTAVINDGG